MSTHVTLQPEEYADYESMIITVRLDSMACSSSSSIIIALLLPRLIFSSTSVAAVSTCDDGETEIIISITPNSSISGTTDSEQSRNLMINNGCSGSDQQYACQTLKNGLELMSSIGNNCVLFTVSLEPGAVYVLEWPVVVNASVHMTSSIIWQQDGGPPSRRAIIRCGFDGDIASELTGGLHSLYFNDSSSVSFSGIDFSNCPLPIRIYQSNNVTIMDSSFRYFREAVFDIHNCIDVTISSCVFSDNYGTGIIREPYRGNTGGLSITYNNLNINTTTRNPAVRVSNCTFNNNSAVPNTSLNSDQILSEGILTGRGGGMAVFVRENHFIIQALICDCYYSRNMAASYGGGLYLLFINRDTTIRHVAIVENNVFESNRANLGGAGAIVYTIGYHSYTFRNCTLKDNAGNKGVGLLYSTQIQTATIVIDGCMFDGNQFLNNTRESFGAALAMYHVKYYEQRSSVTSNSSRIQDCTFIKNVGESSIVSVAFESLEFSGTNVFINNTGTAVRLFGQSSTLSGRMDFIGNQALDGAAIQLLSYSQLLLSDGLQLFFSGNIGRFGACIAVSGFLSTKTFQNLLHNPTCPFILKTQPSTSPTLWHERKINVTFTKNSALFGSAIFMSSLMPCSWVNGSEFDVNYFPMWPIFHIRKDNINSGVSDSWNQAYSITSDPLKTVLESTGNTTEMWPGGVEHLSIYSMDELGNPTGSITRLAFQANNITDVEDCSSDIHIHPNVVLVKRERSPINFSYTLDKEKYEFDKFVGEISTSISGVLLLSQESNGTSIPLAAGTYCAGGFVINATSSNNDHFSCQCDKNVHKILLCEEDQDSILIQSGEWASVSDKVSGKIFFYSCPMGYCRCFLNTSLGSDSCYNMFVNSDPDRQCVCGREGILCGECSSDSHGVTVLLNICTSSCGDGSIAAVPFLIIISAIVMIIIILIDKPLPQWCHPVTFSLQVAPVMALQFSFSFIVAVRFEIYVASFLSFYFPFDFCLFNKMKSLSSFGLRYTPALTALIFIPLAIAIRHFLRIYFLVFKLRSFKGHGIWTIVLLVYTLTAYTSLNILNCPMLPDSDGNFSPRWYIDGSVKCFEGNHIPLALVAVLCLLLQVLMIPLIGCKMAIVRRYFIGLGPIEEMLKASFKANFEYWYAVELFRRLLVVFLITVAPTNTSLLLLIIMALTMIYGYWKPYKSRAVNFLELGLLVVLLTLLALKINPFFQDSLAGIVNSVNSTESIPECDTGAVALTKLSILLSVIYYIPLLVGIAYVIAWIAQQVYSNHKMRQSKKSEKYKRKLEMSNIAFMLSYESLSTPLHSSSEVTIS